MYRINSIENQITSGKNFKTYAEAISAWEKEIVNASWSDDGIILELWHVCSHKRKQNARSYIMRICALNSTTVG